MLKLAQRTQIKTDEVTIPLHEIAQLQQSEKLESHNLAGDEGDSHDEVANHLDHVQHALDLLSCPTL